MEADAPVVGRGRERQRLDALVSSVADGTGGVAVVAGAAGTGKTTLLEWAAAAAAQRGVAVLRGAAYPLGAGLPYGPIVDALRSGMADLDPVRRAAALTGAGGLGALLPELRLNQPEPLGDDGLERARLFQAVADLLERLAGRGGAVVILDDLHWANAETAALLEYVARRLAGTPLLLLLASRPLTAETPAHLRLLHRSLSRLGAVVLSVPRLPPTDVRQLAEAHLADEPPAALLELLEQRAAGVPLIVVALLRALVEQGGLKRSGPDWVLVEEASEVVPEAVEHLFAEQLDSLGHTQRRIVELLALAGGGLTGRALEEAVDRPEEQVRTEVARLVAAGVVAEQPGAGALLIGHPLLGEVVAAALATPARTRLHADLARALEAVGSPDQDRLARHYGEAGDRVDPVRACEVLLAAGVRALESQSHADAALHLCRALQLARRTAPHTTGPLLELYGVALARTGRTDEAEACWNEALDALPSHSGKPSAARAGLHRRLASIAQRRARLAEAAAHVDAGLAAVEGAEREAAETAADLRYARVRLAGLLGDVATTDAALRALDRLADDVGSPVVTAQASLAHAVVAIDAGDFLDAREAAVRALWAARSSGRSGLISRVLFTVSRVTGALGDHQAAIRLAEEQVSLARRVGIPALEVFPTVALTGLSWLAGDWDVARAASREALALAARVSSPRALAAALGGRAWVLLHDGEIDAAAEHVTEAHEVVADGRGAGDATEVADVTAVLVALARGEHARARALTAAMPRGPLYGGTPGGGLAVIGQVCAATGDPAGALEIAHALRALRAGRDAYPAGVGARVEGLARHALGDHRAAVHSLSEAVEVFEALAAPFEAARTRLECATALAALGSSDRAAAEAQAALTVLGRLGAAHVAAEARQLLRRLGRTVAAPAPPRRPGPAADLSPRQLEVARLVAQGRSSAEIAAALFISTRTVEAHLDHAYRRLGISSRAALSSWVTRRPHASSAVPDVRTPTDTERTSRP